MPTCNAPIFEIVEATELHYVGRCGQPAVWEHCRFDHCLCDEHLEGQGILKDHYYPISGVEDPEVGF